jgi:hypothetical protein
MAQVARRHVRWDRVLWLVAFAAAILFSWFVVLRVIEIIFDA